MAMEKSPESFTFTVGKLDAGMAILLGERAHLIEFPSILLPPGATAGSIVNIAVHQNHAEEKKRDAEFWQLQGDILHEYGVATPESPDLNLRNVTQTSVTLEWPTIKLATAKLRSLDIYRNGQRLAAIPSPLTNTSTKLSGLELNTDYTFQLILRTSAGTFPSNLLRVRTHTMQDTSGICVCFGNVQDEVLLENSKLALREMGAKWSDKIQIDTTHFVCTTPAATPTGAQVAGNTSAAPGVEYQRALQLSIPVVQPHWILACHSEKRMVPIAAYYLGATTTPVASAGFTQRPQSMSQANLHHHNPSSPPLPKNNRSSMPPPARSPPTSAPGTAAGAQSAFVNQPRFEPVEEDSERSDTEEVRLEHTPSARSKISQDEGEKEGEVETETTNKEAKRKSRAGTMNRDFKFPRSQSQSNSPAPPLPGTESGTATPTPASTAAAAAATKPPALGNQKSKEGDEPAIVTPSSIEVPPPPPVEKERSIHSRNSVDEGDDEVGDTVEVDLS